MHYLVKIINSVSSVILFNILFNYPEPLNTSYYFHSCYHPNYYCIIKSCYNLPDFTVTFHKMRSL
jgi:hypothetical protein